LADALLGQASYGEQRDHNDQEVIVKIIPKDEKRCIWMDAGVVSYKLCPNNYNCNDCPFDAAMMKRISEAKRIHVPEASRSKATPPKYNESWMKRFRDLPASQRKCRYMLQGLVRYKLCANNFDCGNCAYDQMFQDRIPPAPRIDVDSIPLVAGYRMPNDVYYHRGHSWARMEFAGRVRLGMDDFSSRVMGKVDGFELPPIGRPVKQGEPAWKIHRDSETVDVLSPVEGVVTQVNETMVSDPGKRESSYGDGWLLMVEPIHLQRRLRSLLYGDSATVWIEEEANRLMETIPSEVGVALADGGVPVEDIYENIKGMDWSEFIRQFLLT
jgi:glycine cleavage system H lipoate-binding protein